MNNILRKSVCLAPIIFSWLFICAQGITGVWNGTLHGRYRDIPIVFHIGRDSTGKSIASFDSPAEKAFGFPVSEVIIKKDSVILMMVMVNGKYAGVLSQDKKTIDGMWFRGNAAFPLAVTRTSDSATVYQPQRPQTPRPPFPYQVKEVEYWNADKSIHYGATLTWPAEDPANPRKKGFPAVLLVTGSGPQDRDETMAGHKPFAVIADNLTKRGFLVMRVDDRGVGKTTGDFNQATTLDFAKDVEAGLDFLEAQPEVQKQNIGLIGHSEGALIAPMVADERKEVKFIVLLAGPGIPTIDLMQQQWEAIAVSEGRTPTEARRISGFLRLICEEVNKEQDTATLFKNARARFDVWAKTLDTTETLKIENRMGDSAEYYIRRAMPLMTSKWLRYFITIDPQPYLQKLQCKVLALNGSRDILVIAEPNLAGIRASLQKSHSPEYDVIELPGLNHLFQTCIRCNMEEFGDLEVTISPKTLEIMDDWLLKNVQ